MRSSTTPVHKPPRYSRKSGYLWLCAWTLLVWGSAFIGTRIHSHDATMHAQFVAAAYIDKDLAVRAWITQHGGVYVRPTRDTPPNPWLTVPERDVVTTDGVALTLINPAYATRQILETFSARHGTSGHLTALKLKNPSNAPDAWEAQALKRLEDGEREVVEEVEDGGGTKLRMMRPVFMEPGCLNCHSDMGIPVGGLRGGLSATVPMAPFIEGADVDTQKSLATHGIIWLFGLGIIGLNIRRGREYYEEHREALQLAQREDRRIAEVLSLSERLDNLDETEIIQEGLETAVTLTGSAIGYFHFVNEDQNSIELVTWSKATTEHYCQITHDNHYPLEQAGVWADCARLHQPVVHNDYPALAIKRGLPEGHAELVRHMSVPVVESGLVRVITGVGNKEQPYDEHDVRLMQLLANDIWKLVQRKRADTSLRENAQQLRQAQQLARLGSWTLEHDSGACTWSEQMYRLLGCVPGEAPPTAQMLARALERGQQDAADRWLHILASQPEYSGLHRLPQADGQLRMLHVRAVTQFHPDGIPERSSGTVQDLTEQQEMETLRRSKADLTALLEHTDRMIWSISADERLIIGNSLFQKAMTRLTGHSLAAGELVPPPGRGTDVQDRWRSCLLRAQKGESFSLEIRLCEPHDHPRWLDFAFFPIRDDEDAPVHTITIFGRDHTERRQLEESRQLTLDELAHTVQQLEALHLRSMRINRLNDLLMSCRREDEACRIIGGAFAEVFEGYNGCLALNRPGGELQRVATWGPDAPRTLEYFGLDDCWALRRGEMHEVTATLGLPCQHFQTSPPHGYICLPLVVRGETLGLLSVEYKTTPTPAQAAELAELMNTVAETVKLAISNLRLRVALEERATHDALTGLFNRRYLDDTLPREVHRAQRNGGRLTVVMLDIDHFKAFNDNMGHEAGDLVLRELGRLLMQNLRRSDIGCRYGGEELLLILPDSGAEEAAHRMQDVCNQIRTLRIPFRNTPLPPITVSVGIASTEVLPFDPSALLRAADEALYAAKQGGRDRIEIAALPD